MNLRENQTNFFYFFLGKIFKFKKHKIHQNYKYYRPIKY